MVDHAGASPARVLLLAADACDAEVAAGFAEAGTMPVLAGLQERAAVVDTIAPRGLFVGAVWPTIMTGLDADRHRYYTWLALDEDGYGTHQTTPLVMQGEPFWTALDAAGRRCAVFDVPHSLADRTPDGFGGAVVSEWGCHDRHVGPASHPPELLAELEAVAGGSHFGAGATPGFDQHAPCDYLHRSQRHRSPDEVAALVDELRLGHARKREASLALLDRAGWDLFVSVFGETHCTGHQLWAQHDRDHPRHDAALRRRLGDPLEAMYRDVDETIGLHLRRAGDDAVAFVLLSHGMGPHHDGTHLLDHLLLRIEQADAGRLDTGWRTRLVGGVVDRAPDAVQDRVGAWAAPWLRRRLAAAPPEPADPPADAEGMLPIDRSRRSWFSIPNNTVTGAIRINVAGREPAGVVDPAEYDRACELISRRLREVVDVDTGRPLVTDVVRVDRAMRRRDGDGLPDLLVEWDHATLVERVWSPHLGTVVAPYEHWRTGDHHRRGRLFVVGPGIAAGRRRGPRSLAHLAPTLAAALGVRLADVDGRPQQDLLPERVLVPV
ncbi:MAG: alkaline phosphatase family protein [Acidimicrobiales bacterium]